MWTMQRHARFLVGLGLLLTMGLSIAETAWASRCAPVMAEMDAGHAAGMEPMDGLPAKHACPPRHDHNPQERGNTEIPCPFAPAGATQGCAASAVLPGKVASLNPALDEAAADPSQVETTPNLLHTASIFHPPKA